ncbi:MAG: PH domain-containing protein [Candidatus Saccharimonadales bacterium]
MVTLQEVEKQLEAIGANSKFWGRAEIIELQHILVSGEQIQACLNGRYSGGFATFVATDQRLLLVDKKLFYLTIEDMRYDMISEVDFGAQLMSGTIKVCTPTKNLTFTTFKPKPLREVTNYIQQRVMQVRHMYSSQSEPQPAATNALPEVTDTPYAAVIGNQAVIVAGSEDLLPTPARRNPYMHPPVMMRRRIGRFGSIGAPHNNPGA